jgi:hypothetical protein
MEGGMLEGREDRDVDIVERLSGEPMSIIRSEEP